MANNKKYITEIQLKQEIKEFEQLQDKIYAEFAASVRHIECELEQLKIKSGKRSRRAEIRNTYLCLLIMMSVIAIVILFSFHAEH